MLDSKKKVISCVSSTERTSISASFLKIVTLILNHYVVKHALILWKQFVGTRADINVGCHTAVLQVRELIWLMSSTHEEVTRFCACTCLPWAADPGLMLGELNVSSSQQHSPCQPNKGPTCSPQSHRQISGFIHDNNWTAAFGRLRYVPPLKSPVASLAAVNRCPHKEQAVSRSLCSDYLLRLCCCNMLAFRLPTL